MSTPTILTVGAGQQYRTSAAAIAAANTMSGGVIINVTAGTYVNDGGAITNDDVVVEGVGGVAKLVGASAGTGGAAAFSASGTNIKFANFDISGVAAGAGILVKSGSVTIDAVKVHDNQVGILAVDNPDTTLTISNSGIDHNDINVDAGGIANLKLSSSFIEDAQGGDEVRSAAAQTNILYDTIADNDSNAAYTLDLPKAGKVNILGAMLEKGAASSAGSVISYGTPLLPASGALVAMSGDYIINDVFPATDTLFDGPVPNFIVVGTNRTWNLPNIGGGLGATPTTFSPLDMREAPQTFDDYRYWDGPRISTIIGNRDGGVTVTGSFDAGGTVADTGATVTVAETVNGTTTLLGSTTTDSNFRFSFTSHAKIDPSTLHGYTVSGTDSSGRVTSMPGALFLTDTGADHLVSAPGVQNVFAVMSFKGSDIIDGFKTTASDWLLHDVINFSGRGITNFTQVQAMMSGSTSTVLTMASGKTITLEGVSPTTLSASDFRYS